MENKENGGISEEKDEEFLHELQSLTKQLKTDEEIQQDFKSQQKLKKEKEQKKEIDEKQNNNENSKNENPFNEAFNLMNSNGQNFLDFNSGNIMVDSLNTLSSKMYQFNSLLINTINHDKSNGEEDNKNENALDEKQTHLMEEILDFLIQGNLLKDTVLNMKKSIDDSFEKNKNNLKSEENKKYEEAALSANNILNEISKIHPDKGKILDSLKQLQQISNDIDNMLKANIK